MTTDYTDDVAEFKKGFDEVHEVWTESGFYERRGYWSDLINRRAKVVLDSFLETHADGIDPQSHVLEKDRGTHIMTLTLDAPRFDTVSLDQTEKGKEDVEKNRIWHAASFMKQNKGGWQMRSIAQGVVQYGVWFGRKDWKMPLEPKEEELKRRIDAMRGEDEDDDTYEAKRLDRTTKARTDYFHEQKEHCFTTVDVSPLEMCCSPVDDPKVYYQRSIIPYSVVKKSLKSLDGKRVRLDELGKILLLGDSEPDPEDSHYTTTTGRKNIELIIRDQEDPETGEWECTEYICAEGEDWSTHGAQLTKYKNPLGRSRYFKVESGESPPLETDPHLRFRPMLYSEYVIVGEMNYNKKLLAVLARMQLDGKLIYLDASKITPEAARAAGLDGFSPEGPGAQTVVGQARRIGDHEVAVMATELKAWPFPTIEALNTLIQMNQRDLEAERPSRFGNRYGDAKEPDTATQQLDNRQADALPYSSYLEKFAECFEAMAQAEANAIIYWDRGAPQGALKSYSVAAIDAKPALMVAPDDVAASITVSAETFKRDYHIVVKITNVTQAEKMQSDLAADDAYHVKRILTEEQYYEKRGFENPLQQIKDVERDRTRKENIEELRPYRALKRKQYISAVMGTDVVAPAPPTRQEMMGQKQGTQATGSLVRAEPQMTPPPIERGSAQSSPGGVPL